MRQFFVFVFAVCLTVPVRGQTGQFDNIVLDGGSLLPLISMQKSNFSHLIAAFQDRIGFSVNGEYKFAISENAQEDALVLGQFGAEVMGAVRITHGSGSNQIPISFFDPDTGDNFVVSIIGTQGDKVMQLGSTTGKVGGFQLDENAPSKALTVQETGVGVGIGSIVQAAQAPFHVYTDGNSLSSPFDESRILVENANDSVAVRDMFELINNGGSRFTFTDTSIDSRWEFSSNGTGAFSISKAGTGGSEMRITPSGRVIMGPGGAANMDLRPNGDMIIAGTLVQSSDRNRKKNLKPVDTRKVLDRLAKMPVYTWQFDNEESEVTHMGPTAQDFREAFDLGYNETTIAPVDTIGVSLAAVQALHSQSEAKDNRIRKLERELANVKAELARNRRLQDERFQILLQKLRQVEHTSR